MVDPGFKLCTPILKRAAGRPRKSGIRPRSEGAGLGARKCKCTRCGGSGHFGKYCDNTVDPAFGESFDEGFDENVGQQPVASTDDENDGQHPVALDEDFDEVPNDDGQQPHDFDDDPKYPPNNDSSEAPNGDPSEAPNGDHGDPSEAPNDDPSEAPNGDQPSVVVSSASSMIGLKKTRKVPTTKRRREEAMSTRCTRSKVIARSSRNRQKPQRYL
nr:uncharacterized protein LOC120964961 [Aegilops tauschii subsp. strangulata]